MLRTRDRNGVEDDLLIRLPDTPAGRRRRLVSRLTAAGAGVVVVAAAGVVIVVTRSGNEDLCDPGVTRRAGDCVGVTDGTYVFESELRAVEGKIQKENDRIGDQPHVTIALMASLTSGDGGLVSIKRIRSQVEGAYVAQHTENASGVSPKIKLVLANIGNREQARSEVTEQVMGLTGGGDHLVAVVGPGLSTRGTATTLKALSRKEIPVVGNQITGDNLNAVGAGVGGPFPGVVKVNVTAGDELSVLADHLGRHRPDIRTAMLISDSNPDDLYTGALQTDFTRGKLARYWTAGGRVVQPYDGRQPASAQFRAIVSNLCGENSPDTIFYAGRALLLPDFVQRLRQRTCARDRAVTIVTGSDASALTDTLPAPRDTDAPVSLVYVPLAAPTALASPKWNPELAQYRRFQAAFTQQAGFDGRDLSDGWAMMTHDAVLAASIAVERASDQAGAIPQPRDIGNILRLLNSPSTSVPGAAGTFTFDPTTGNVRGRRLHVLELRPDGRLVIQGMYSQPVPR